MSYPVDQTDALKPYCNKLSSFEEGGITFLLLEKLKLPDGCTPAECDALLCPVAKDGYDSRLYFEAKIECRYNRNWNAADVRIGQRNWFAFSWRVAPPMATLQDLLIAHLNGFAKAA